MVVITSVVTICVGAVRIVGDDDVVVLVKVVALAGVMASGEVTLSCVVSITGSVVVTMSDCGFPRACNKLKNRFDSSNTFVVAVEVVDVDVIVVVVVVVVVVLIVVVEIVVVVVFVLLIFLAVVCLKSTTICGVVVFGCFFGFGAFTFLVLGAGVVLYLAVESAHFIQFTCFSSKMSTVYVELHASITKPSNSIWTTSLWLPLIMPAFFRFITLFLNRGMPSQSIRISRNNIKIV
mgnify:CR=1 FL=1